MWKKLNVLACLWRFYLGRIYLHKVITAVLTALFIGSVSTVWGQVVAEINIISTHTTPQENVLNVAVYFTLRDEMGRPLPPSTLNQATIQLLDSNQSAPAVVTQPHTPIYMSLVIDASGSMAGVLDEVKQAATAAIDQAPPNALFNVVQFNESHRTVIPFTADRTLIKNGIAQIKTENKGSCLYDTLYHTIEHLDEQSTTSAERRAIILFTDGRDQLRVGDDTPCSTLTTFDQLLSRANGRSTTASTTPIYTIGLSANSDDVDREELARLAHETAALSAVGNVGQLPALFATIMQELNSQLVATADLYPSQGDNQARLILEGEQNGIADALFTFDSPQNYQAPARPPAIQAEPYRYDASSETYQIPLLIAQAQDTAQLLVLVSNNNQFVTELLIDPHQAAPIVTLNGADFIAGQTYSLEFRALTASSHLIPNAKGELGLAHTTIQHQHVEPSRQFTIRTVQQPDYQAGTLTLLLDIPEPDWVDLIAIDLVNGGTGTAVLTTPAHPYTGSTIIMQLPSEIAEATAAQSYLLTVRLTDRLGATYTASYADFRPEPPPRCGLFCTIGRSLISRPLILALLLLVICGLATFLAYHWLQTQRKKEPPKPPPVVAPGHTMVGYRPNEPAAPKDDRLDHFFTAPQQAKVTLTVLRSAAPQNSPPPITTYPFVIGRAPDCHYQLIEDRTISRQHLQLDWVDDSINVINLSPNGTTVNQQQMAQGQGFVLHHVVQLQLGKNIVVELTPHSDKAAQLVNSTPLY